MLRPTRNTLFGCALCLILASSSLAGCMQTAATPKSNDATRVRDQFDNCVYTSAGNLLRAKVSTDVNTVAEAAFQACATEEQAIIQFMRLNGFDETIIGAMITKIRMDVKNTIKRIVNDPQYRGKLGMVAN